MCPKCKEKNLLCIEEICKLKFANLVAKCHISEVNINYLKYSQMLRNHDGRVVMRPAWKPKGQEFNLLISYVLLTVESTYKQRPVICTYKRLGLSS